MGGGEGRIRREEEDEGVEWRGRRMEKDNGGGGWRRREEKEGGGGVRRRTHLCQDKALNFNDNLNIAYMVFTIFETYMQIVIIFSLNKNLS